MKKAILTILALMIGAMISTGAFATVPDLIPVQGVLADSADAPVDALTDITFNLYNVDTGGTALWTDTFVDVDVVEGFFTVYLGDNTALDFGSLITNAEIWVGITVESDPEMDRFQLATVPFAIEAQVSQQVGSLTEGDIITTSDPAGGITSTQVSNWDNAASLYAPISHTHDWSDLTGVPAGLADGDDNTNAATICAAGQFLNGDGSCDAVVVNTNTNAATICASGYYLNGDTSCDIGDASGNCAAGAVCTGGHHHELPGAGTEAVSGTCRVVQSPYCLGAAATTTAYNALQNCTAAAVGALCEGDGECGTNPGLDNCTPSGGWYELYIKVSN